MLQHIASGGITSCYITLHTSKNGSISSIDHLLGSFSLLLIVWKKCLQNENFKLPTRLMDVMQSFPSFV